MAYGHEECSLAACVGMRKRCAGADERLRRCEAAAHPSMCEWAAGAVSALLRVLRTVCARIR